MLVLLPRMDVAIGRLFGVAGGGRVHTTCYTDGRGVCVDTRVGLEGYEGEQIYSVLHQAT